MKQCSRGIDGLRTGLSPSARPFPIGSSSSHDDSVWGDYTLDLSFLSSDDQRSALGDDDSLSNLSRDVETTKEGLILEDKIAFSGNVLLNSNPLPELLIKSSNVAGDKKMDQSCADANDMSENSFTDSEEDSPCWRGIHSHKTLASGTKSVSSRRSTDDLSGFYRLNPLAPQFIPSSSKKKCDMDGEKYEENSSSSLRKSLSSTFPSSSGEFNLRDPLEDGRNDATVGTSILTDNADEILGFVSSDSVSKTVTISDSKNEFQPPKRLDPLAPVFVPSSAKLSPSVHEKLGDFKTDAHSSALTSSHDKSLNKVKVERRSGEVGRSIKIQYSDGVHELGSTSSYNPWIESDFGITEHVKLRSSSNKSHGQRRLNPLAPQFSLADSKPKAYGYYKNQAADDLSLVVNTGGVFPPTGYMDYSGVDVDLAQSSVDMEDILPNMSRGSSSLISPKLDGNFGSTKWISVEPKTTLSVKGNKDFKHPLPFHVVGTAGTSSSGDVKLLSGSSPKMNVKKLLTTMHGLSELLALAHGSESADSSNAEELALINSTVQNLDLYIKNSSQEQAGNQSITQHNSYDLKLLPNKSKLSIRDLQLPTANNMTVDLDVKRKDKYSVIARETVPDSRLYYGATKDNGFGQVVAKSGYPQNHQGEEQINQHALFYKSLWLKSEADRCLMVYETSLSNRIP